MKGSWEEVCTRVWFGDVSGDVVGVLVSKGDLTERDIIRFTSEHPGSVIRRALLVLEVFEVVKMHVETEEVDKSGKGWASSGTSGVTGRDGRYVLNQEGLWMRWRVPRFIGVVRRVTEDPNCEEVMVMVMERGRAWNKELCSGHREMAMERMVRDRWLLPVLVHDTSISSRKRKRLGMEDEVQLKSEVSGPNGLWRPNFGLLNRLLTVELMKQLVTVRIDGLAAEIIEIALKRALMSEEMDTVEKEKIRERVESCGMHKEELQRQLSKTLLGAGITRTKLDDYLTILRRPECGYIQFINRSSNTFYLNFRRLAIELKRQVVESYIETSLGVNSRRIFRLLTEKHFIEQRHVSDLAMLPAKTVRESLYRLHLVGLVQMQEVPTADYKTSRSVFLWSADILESTHSLAQRMLTISRNVACQITTYSDNKKLNSSRRREVMERLEVTMSRIDKLVFILRDLSC
mmetsp:Transcript_8878/g.17912  ORF Transcript_8878/g.17912 Transcript_8878/m.17912 type:complete len:460 (-) Transcript_8878:125-1504(-)